MHILFWTLVALFAWFAASAVWFIRGMQRKISPAALHSKWEAIFIPPTILMAILIRFLCDLCQGRQNHPK